MSLRECLTYSWPDLFTWCSWTFLIALPKYVSNPSPRNTKTTPTHCRPRRGWENIITEPRMVKNFRVVVKIEQVSGPKCVTVKKIKFCVWGGVCTCILKLHHMTWYIHHMTCMYLTNSTSNSKQKYSWDNVRVTLHEPYGLWPLPWEEHSHTQVHRWVNVDSIHHMMCLHIMFGRQLVL